MPLGGGHRALLCPKMLGEPLVGSSPHLLVAKRFSHVLPTAIDMGLIVLFS
jgi:hypothetical protein